MSALIDNIKADLPVHGSIPFWSWNDKLEKEELHRQIRNMKAMGMRGFFMHARCGLETKYMSDEWFDAISSCIDEARKQGMEAWAYDENGWPSGFAGGKLLADSGNWAAYINLCHSKLYPELSDDILGVYVEENGKIRRLKSPCDAPEYLYIERSRDFSYVDTMDKDVIAKFIEATHEEYKKRIDSRAFGSVMPGFFTDEPQYFRWGTQWSDSFLVTFKEMFGYDVLDKLPLLFIEAEGYRAFRYDYYLHCHRSFCDAYMKQIYKWCDKNGVQLTGHGIEEWTLHGQLMCCGGIMPFYCYEHIPGIDYLGRNVKDPSGAKQLGSVCAQLGKKVALSEMYACCGWDVTPRELKRIADVQYVGGVNLTCEHLYAYSERGQRKRDYPCHYSEHNPWQKYYPAYEKHFKNLGAALAQGREIADTLVIHPVRNAYLNYKNKDKLSIEKEELDFKEFIDSFDIHQIPYHFGDEGMLADMGAVFGDKIRLGCCTYDKVVLPYLSNLDESTAKLLREYLANGGRLLVLGDAPVYINGREGDLSYIKSTMTFEELAAESGFAISHSGSNVPLHARLSDTGCGKMLFITNTSDVEYANTEIHLKGWKCAALLDIDTLEYQPLRAKWGGDGIDVLFDFGDSVSCLIVEEPCDFLPYEKTVKSEKIKLGSFTLDYLPENMLTLDRAMISLNGADYTELRPIERIRDELLRERFCGTLSLKFRFYVEKVPEELTLVAEPMRYITLKVNGKPFVFSGGWKFDRSFQTADIAGLAVPGENEIELSFDYRQSERVYQALYSGGNEALRNCLAFDTEVEAIYLYGDFGVKSEDFTACERNTYRCTGNFSLIGRTREIDLTCINQSGYVFFAGEMTASTVISYRKGDPTLLSLGGRFAVCRAVINGHDLGANLFEDEFELANYLREGDNTLTLTLCFSNRNLLGPHHRKNPEPLSVNPGTFTFEKKWKDGECADFVPDYAFVRHGIGF